MSAHDYLQRIADILGTKLIDGRIEIDFHADTVEQAKAMLPRFTLQQKQLRQLKREIGQDTRVIRAQYKERAANVQPSSGASLLGLFGKRGASRTSVADERRRLARERDAQLVGYDNVKLMIDNVLIQIDAIKLEFNEFISQE